MFYIDCLSTTYKYKLVSCARTEQRKILERDPDLKTFRNTYSSWGLLLSLLDDIELCEGYDIIAGRMEKNVY